MRKGLNLSWLKVIGHILFWVVYAVLNYYFLEGKFNAKFALNRSLLLISIQIPIVYFNIGILIPQFFLRKKYLLYTGLLILLLILSNFILEFILQSFHNLFFFYERGYRRPMGPPGTRNALNYFLGLFLLLLSTVIELATISARREKEAQLKRSENLDAELKFLRSQINPHFLFNTLNNLYALAVTKSGQTPAVIMQLSNMLRYNLYEANDKEKVPIEKEIAYIKDYINLYQLKDEDLKNQVSFRYTIKQSAAIAPMLLIPFVENAFKHSQMDEKSKANIAIDLEVTTDQITFKVSNTLPQLTFQKDETGGIGIENVKKRIALIYPDKSKLVIKEENSVFNIQLTIDLK